MSEENEPEFVNRGQPFYSCKSRVMILNKRRTLDLLPFWKNETEFHRSTTDPVRYFTQFLATYPEFVGLENASDEEKRAAIQAKVDELYDPNNKRRGIVLRSAESVNAIPEPKVVKPRGALKAAGVANAASATQPALATERCDWFVRIRVKKFQLQQSFTVLIFLGSAPNEVSEWRSSPNLVGSYGEFVNSNADNCVNCGNTADIITEGFIQLDDAFDRLGYGQKSEDEIEKFVRAEINWRIQKVCYD